jgi:hypothetical protein
MATEECFRASVRVRGPKYVRWRLWRIRRFGWSIRNWCKGYKFGAIRRFRCCDHTTPAHYQWCKNRVEP